MWHSYKRMKNNTFTNIHFVGIGGIGMSALAQLLAHDGVIVTGSDRSAGPTTELLESKGIHVHIGQRAENVTDAADAVVYSDAVVEGSEGYPERLRARELGIPEFSYFQMLGKVSEGKRTVAVAGTHGKTTTTGMLAKILIDAGTSPTVIVGSITKDFGSNYVAGDSDLFVVEACEYRDHLLELSPEVLVITNLEWDHTDWFPSIEAMQETFHKAARAVPQHGAIITNPNDPIIAAVLSDALAPIIDYTIEPSYDLKLTGHFNVQNARAAAAAARFASPKATADVIETSLAAFSGTWRRFEYKGKTANGALIYDDYAHHPTAVRETIKMLRMQTRGKVYVAFHPHLFSRTRDLFNDFAVAFENADKVFIAPIYAAREVDDGSVSSEKLAAAIRARGVDATALDFAAIEKAFAEASPGDAVMTMGAGDIYKVAEAIVKK